MIELHVTLQVILADTDDRKFPVAVPGQRVNGVAEIT
jgi:hypothetical protein